jgi:hypothetical protein
LEAILGLALATEPSATFGQEGAGESKHVTRKPILIWKNSTAKIILLQLNNIDLNNGSKTKDQAEETQEEEVEN